MQSGGTHATWLACGRKAAASASRSGAERGRAPLMTGPRVAWERVCQRARARSPLVAVSRGGLLLLRVRWRGAWRSTAPAAAPLSIAAGVTRAGTACRSSYRPSRRRSRCDAYSPPNYYTTGLLRIKTSNLRATPRKINLTCFYRLVNFTTFNLDTVSEYC